RPVREPLLQLPAACRGAPVHLAGRSAIGGFDAAFQQALLFQPLERAIDLREIRGPEVVEHLLELALDVVARGRFAQDAEQDVIEAHAGLNTISARAAYGASVASVPLHIQLRETRAYASRSNSAARATASICRCAGSAQRLKITAEATNNASPAQIQNVNSG